MNVTRIAVRNILSYAGPHVTVLGDLGRVNVIVGKNDAGKSNLLRVVRWARDVAQLPDVQKQDIMLPANWLHVSARQQSGGDHSSNQSHMSVSFRIEIDDWPKGLIPLWLEAATACKPTVSFTVSLSDEREPLRVIENLEWGRDAELMNLFAINHADPGDMAIRLLPHARKVLASKVVMLDGWRQPSTRVLGEKNYAELLESFQNSKDDADEAGKSCQRIESLFEFLTGENEIRLHRRDVSHADFNVRIRGNTIPLSQHGDGYVQMLMIAINAAINPGGVFLIEEPETHLHPDSQRRLLWHFSEHMNAQLFITTHSAAFLDSRKADCILHISRKDDRSEVIRVSSLERHYATLDDIGARASDILQANVVIWVEGPSDRILIKHALSIVDKTIREGLHYQIVCYGGALRKYCRIGEGSDRLVNLLRLGRCAVMVCDRDGEQPSKRLNKEKERLREECVEAGGISWVTYGREIENYLSNAVLSRAFGKLLEVPELRLRLGKNQRLVQALQSVQCNVGQGAKKWLRYDSNKPEIMTKIVDHITERSDLDRHDFLDQLDILAAFIRKKNAIPGLASF
jgi:predicted ATPase